MSGKYVTAFTNGVNKSGFTNTGKIAIDTNPGSGDYSIANFVGGVISGYDSTGYIIITDTTTSGVDTRSTGNHTGTASANTPTFWVSPTKNDVGFLYLVNRLPARKGLTPFTVGSDAKTWLNDNGYWTSYVGIASILSLDAANYSGTGNWIDSVGGKQFTLYNTPTWSSSNGGYFNFDASSSQYASSTTSLSDLNNWTIGVWHYYTGDNVGSAPCILTELYPGITSKINYSLGNNNGGFSSGFFNGGWRITTTYTLTPESWYNIVGTYDGNMLKMYVNNALVATSSYTGAPISSQGGIRLMTRWDLPDYWDGKLAKVDIYNVALSSTQITSIWNSTKSRFGLSLSIATNAGGVLDGFAVGGQAVAFAILANPAIGTTYPIGSQITFQNGEVRTFVGYDDYGSQYDMFYDSPISTSTLFPITIG